MRISTTCCVSNATEDLETSEGHEDELELYSSIHAPQQLPQSHNFHLCEHSTQELDYPNFDRVLLANVTLALNCVRKTVTQIITITRSRSSSTQTDTSASATNSSESGTSVDKPNEQTSISGGSPMLAVIKATQTNEQPNSPSPSTGAPQGDKDPDTNVEQYMSDADGSLAEAYRNLIACDSHECKELKTKIVSWRGEIISAVGAVVTATSGWAGTDQHGALPEAMESTTSTMPVAPIGIMKSPDAERTSQSMIHSSMPPAATTAGDPSKQDSTITKSSTLAAVTPKTEALTSTGTHQRSPPRHHSGTKTGTRPINDPMGPSLSIMIWRGIQGSSNRPAFMPMSSMPVSAVVGEASKTSHGYAMPSGESYHHAIYSTGHVPKPTTLVTRTSSRESIVDIILSPVDHTPTPTFALSISATGLNSEQSAIVNRIAKALGATDFTFAPQVSTTIPPIIGETGLISVASEGSTFTTTSTSSAAMTPVSASTLTEGLEKREERMTGNVVRKNFSGHRRRGSSGVKRKRTMDFEGPI
ncbi:hypothetical protein FKW77_000066 [Venturia effusa]|uniref:Uncharacterized protein n=1 Tax=Venturia effusa TaxID=50376 RepID=A0A517LA47_9PEZI|nr:hypothetical protein FKW77_000066 [Venturia effusa]